MKFKLLFRQPAPWILLSACLLAPNGLPRAFAEDVTQHSTSSVCLVKMKAEYDLAVKEMMAASDDALCPYAQKSSPANPKTRGNPRRLNCSAYGEPFPTGYCFPAAEMIAQRKRTRALGIPDDGDIFAQNDRLFDTWIDEQFSAMPAMVPSITCNELIRLPRSETSALQMRLGAAAVLGGEASTLSNTIIGSWYNTIQAQTNQRVAEVVHSYRRDPSTCAQCAEFMNRYRQREIAVYKIGQALNNGLNCLNNVTQALVGP